MRYDEPMKIIAEVRVARIGLLLSLPLLLLSACIYRMPIRQGNYLDPAAIAQVKPGMTHSQVRFLLGTPQVPTDFSPARWDYDYYLNLHHLGTPRREHVVVWFDKGVVSRVQSNVTRAPVTTVTRGGIKYPVPY